MYTKKTINQSIFQKKRDILDKNIKQLHFKLFYDGWKYVNYLYNSNKTN